MKTITLLLTLISIAIFSCNSSHRKKSQDTTSVDTTLNDNSAVDTADHAQSSNWLYNEEVDKMTSQKSFFATTTSSTDLDLSFPYEGSTAGITIRKKRGSTDVLLQVTKGQFNRNYEGTTLKARFGEDKPITFTCSEASSRNSEVLFIDNAKKFISNLKKHKTLIVEVEFYNEGYRQIEFNIGGFEWNH